MSSSSFSKAQVGLVETETDEGSREESDTDFKMIQQSSVLYNKTHNLKSSIYLSYTCKNHHLLFVLTVTKMKPI